MGKPKDPANSAKTALSLFFLLACTLVINACCDCKPCEVCLETPPCPKCSNKTDVKWTVTKVIDGDTLIATQKNRGNPPRKEKIRLLRINTPERNQPGYLEAKKALTRLVLHKKITLQFETPGRETRGNYQRLLAYIYVDNSNINVELVRLGWSHFWIKYGKGRFEAAFVAAEKEARTTQRGLWK